MTVTLKSAYERTVKALQDVDPNLDAALIQTGRELVKAIAPNDPFGEAKPQYYLIPNLVQVLKELHATPEARAAMIARASVAKVGKQTTSTEDVDELEKLRRSKGRGA